MADCSILLQPAKQPVSIIMDTREKIDKKGHILDYIDRLGIPVIRRKLDVGDWARSDDQSVVIDTKTCGLLEVYSNVITQHDRFRRECQRAKDNGVQLIVLVEENGINQLEDVQDWENPRTKQYELRRTGIIKSRSPLPLSPPVSSKRMYGIMRVMSERYGVVWDFCRHDNAGERICEILGLWRTSRGSPSPP